MRGNGIKLREKNEKRGIKLFGKENNELNIS